MNTERPDHDDEPRPVSGDAPDTGGARPRTTSSPEAAASDSDATRTRGADEDAGASRSEGAEGADAGTTDAGAGEAEAAGPQADAPSDTPGDGDGDGDHAYAGSEPVVGAGHDGDRGPEGPARRRSPALIASVAAAGKGNLRVYVLDGPGKIGV
ncbi:hypothetical protein ABZ462_31890, partial [Streptomyces albogriseolus]